MVKIDGLPRYYMGISIYINTKEAANERRHVHIGRGTRKSERDPKIWLEPKVEYSIDEAGLRNFKMHELREMLKFVKKNKDGCMRTWDRMHGAPQLRGAKKKKK